MSVKGSGNDGVIRLNIQDKQAILVLGMHRSGTSALTRVLYLKDRECVYDGDAETATELFLMDMRGEQSAMLDQKMSFQPAINENSMAFGTGEGRLLSVSLSCADEQRSWFRHGERINITLKAWLSDTLKKPALAIAVRDHKGIVIAGFDSRRMKNPLRVDENGEVCCCFSLGAGMLPGVYNLAVRILDFPYGGSDLLIEKQLNAANIEIIDNNIAEGTYGFVSLNGCCE